MTRITKVLSVILAISLLFSVTAVNSITVSAQTAQIAYITGSGINVRKGAGTGYECIDQISYRQVEVIGTKNGWLKVTYQSGKNSVTGYIYNNSEWVRLESYDLELSFEEQLKNFPKSYRADLKKLHKAYPNWVFLPQQVDSSFEQSVELQSANWFKQVQSGSQPISWRSMNKGYYDWSKKDWVYTNGGWAGASREIIMYYMDPRNFLNADEIYMFMAQSYEYSDYTTAGLKKIIKGTFLESGYAVVDGDPYKGSYVKLILAAGEKSGVSPYVLASKILQEQGTGANGISPLISGTYKGYKGYFNFFNWQASGSSTAQVIENGLKYAKEQGWNSVAASIIGGAQLYAKGYVQLGQDTYYYQDFNVNFSNNLWHQYAQAVHDAYSKGASLSKTYSTLTEEKLVFRIPVFEDMPEEKCSQPDKSSKLNNYYLSKISVTGLTPSFYRFTYEYDLQVMGDTVIEAKCPSGASIVSQMEFPLKKGNNKIVITVKSQTGYTNDYTINVNATKKCTVYINKPVEETEEAAQPEEETTSSAEQVVKKIQLGDVTQDGNITISDLVCIKLHMTKQKLLKKDKFTAADIDGNGNITITDLVCVKLYLVGKYELKEIEVTESTEKVENVEDDSNESN